MRPRWKSVIGVLGIIFGCTGLMSASQVVMMPTMLEWQRKFLTTLQAQATNQGPAPAFAGAFREFVEQFLAPAPAWFTPWCIGLGLATLLICGFYVFSAIWLLLPKPAAPRFLCVALVASIGATLARCIGLVLARGVLGLTMGFGGLFGVIIDAVLLAVVLAHRGEWSSVANRVPPVVREMEG